MKFGKVIRKAVTACPMEWQDYWMDYKEFKHIITDIEEEKVSKLKNMEGVKEIDIVTLEKEKLFFQKLAECVYRVDGFFNRIQMDYVVEVRDLIEEVKKVDKMKKEDLENTIERLLERCRLIHGKLLLLEMFAHVNYCGFTKITKKHDRMTGYETQKKFMQKKVNILTFASFSLLRNSVRIVEDQYIVLSKYLSHIKAIPPIAKAEDVKEVNASLEAIDKQDRLDD